MDIFSTDKRSEIMSRIGGKNTMPELAVRRYLHARGLRYLLHARQLPGKPDLCFPSRRIAIFVHGCFWHGHDCKRASLPSTRTDFWATKIGATKKRDERAAAALEAIGWKVIVVWQCELSIDRLDEICRLLRLSH